MIAVRVGAGQANAKGVEWSTHSERPGGGGALLVSHTLCALIAIAMR